MYASFYIPQEKYSTQMRVAEKMMFMGLPHFKDTQSRCKECNRKVDGPGQISVGYQLRKNNVLFMTVRPVPPKSKCKLSFEASKIFTDATLAWNQAISWACAG
ncbi:hypothetical protein FOCG_00342 [Fusarium oxysporum f. sp. radicis-lycopersici 26381]|nr:hypothetical protein FOCG_00342 [Fusarium oxysporum f. sp. radicis-lycopersici 26381]